MEIEKVTPHPSRYAEEPAPWELEELGAQGRERWREQAEGRFWMQARLDWSRGLGITQSANERRSAVQIVSHALGKQAEFHRKGDYYAVDEWIITDGSIMSGPFGMGRRAQNLRVFDALDAAGYRIGEGLSIYYRPASREMNRAYMLAALGERELTQLQERLRLDEEPTLCLGMNGLELSVPLERARHEDLEVCLLFFERLLRAAGLRHRGASVAQATRSVAE